MGFTVSLSLLLARVLGTCGLNLDLTLLLNDILESSM